MKKLFSLLVVLMAICTSSWAGQPVISFSGEVLKGGEGTIVVSLECNGEEIRGFQCDIILPDGFEFTTFSDGKKTHMFESATNMIVGGNSGTSRRRFLVYSSDADPDDPFHGAYSIKNDGPVFEIAIKENGSNSEAGEAALTKVTGSDEPNGDKKIAISCNPPSTGGGNQSFNQDDTDFNIQVFGTILDEESTTLCKEYDGPGVLVKRTIKAGVWNTICLPFAMTNEQMMAAFGENVSLADFKGITFKNNNKDMTIKFASVKPAAIEANHPYIILIDKDEDIKKFSLKGTVEVIPNNNPSLQINNGNFYGTPFMQTFRGMGKFGYHPIYLSSNNFYYLQDGSELTLKGFRAYIDWPLGDYVQANSSANVNFFVDDDAIDGIDGVTTNKVVEGVYDLQGRKVDDEHLKRGVYIIDGKKVVVK